MHSSGAPIPTYQNQCSHIIANYNVKISKIKTGVRMNKKKKIKGIM